MKNIKRIKLWGNSKIKDLFKVDKSAQLQDLYEQQAKQLKEVNSKYYDSQALEKYYKEELDKICELLHKLDKCAKKVKDDDVKLKEVYNNITSLKNKQKTYKEFLVVQTPITEKYHMLKTEVESKTGKLKDKIDEIKMKEEFSKSVNKFNDIQSSSNDINVDDIVKEVQIDFNSSSLKLDDIKTFDIDNIINDSGFEDFKNSIS